jgi:nanoRNase/pAp phosphatase (c-di-AMP/oligoRNAs hydrolase)/glyoxylase-like metal-dependent hydrolase (beta-lactamase superfamily II)
VRSEVVFRDATRSWVIFGQDANKPPDLVDSNQVVVRAGNEAVLIDPGGVEIFPAVFDAVERDVPLADIKHIILTHEDPDAGSSLPLWREVCVDELKVHVPWLWLGYVTHYDREADFVAVPDEGMEIRFGETGRLQLIPAHYLHSPGNFSVFDPAAKALFSGDIGGALVPPDDREGFLVRDFDRHVQYLTGFHQRWMGAPAARDDWIRRVRELQPEIIVPQRGLVFAGENVDRFLNWFETIEIGIAVRGGTPQRVAPAAAPDAERDAETPAASVPQAAPAKPEMPIESPIFGAGKPMIRALKDSGRQFRLITRSDFDGLVCAVLLEELDLIDDILFVHPRQMQYGEVDLNDNDISTNVPFDERVYLAFDHHLSEMERVGGQRDNHVIDPTAPSAARVVYNYFGGEEHFPYVSGELMDAVDQADSAQYDMDDVLNPQGWALLNFIMDPRTGLGRFRGFRIPNYELMMGLIEDCRNHTIEEILELPDVKERVDLYEEHRPKFEEQLKRCTVMHDKLAVIDMRNETEIHCGNRFLIYALYPECNISMHVVRGKQDQNTVFAVGKSIFDRSSPVNVGELMLRFGGGGHRAAGTCQADNPIAEETMAELIHRITSAG